MYNRSQVTASGNVVVYNKMHNTVSCNIAVYHKSHGTVGGVALTFGQGTMGQLGLGVDIVERKKPAKINIEEGVVQVCAGGMHTACLTVSGKVRSVHHSLTLLLVTSQYTSQTMIKV